MLESVRSIGCLYWTYTLIILIPSAWKHRRFLTLPTERMPRRRHRHLWALRATCSQQAIKAWPQPWWKPKPQKSVPWKTELWHGFGIYSHYSLVPWTRLGRSWKYISILFEMLSLLSSCCPWFYWESEHSMAVGGHQSDYLILVAEVIRSLHVSRGIWPQILQPLQQSIQHQPVFLAFLFVWFWGHS